MNKRYGIAAVLLAVLLALAGCADRRPEGGSGAAQSGPPASVAPAQPSGSTAEEKGAPAPQETPDREEPGFINTVVQQTIDRFLEPGMSDFDKAKAAFDYIIETTTLVDPVGLDIWRIHDPVDAMPSFVENRSLSVLLYQVGMCEDYAAALTMLLRGMGLEAEYVPGLTYSTQGQLVDHAWTVAKIDGVWYHLDCQLEQNISRHGTIRYKYFMRGDATMSGSHRWGQNLIDTGLLTAAQNEEIAAGYIFEACPQDYPTPERRTFTFPAAPDRAVLEAMAEAEIREYEETNGPLEPLELPVTPPIFALEGFGPQE